MENADVVGVLVGHDEPLTRRVELEVARRRAPGVLVRRILQCRWRKLKRMTIVLSSVNISKQ